MMEPDESRGEKLPEGDNKELPGSGLKQIRTFQGDVADALHNQNESLVSIQQQEVFKNRAAGIPAGPTPAEIETGKRRNDFIFLLIGSAFFIVVGSIGAWLGYREYMNRIAPPVLSVPESRFISAGKEVEIDLSVLNRESFAAVFADAIRGNSEGNVVHVVMGSSTAQFLAVLETKAPGSLVRAFDKTFMIGSLGPSPFFIAKLASFENAFAGMLSWEASMAGDLVPLFPENDALKAIGPEYVFKDVIIRNKDVRVLSTGQGTSTEDVLLYSFFDNSMLIITDRIEALQTLIERLTREKLSR